MIVDASALIEILRRQSSVQRCLETLSASTSNLISAANFVEACIVADNLPGDQASYELDELMRDFRVEIVPVTPEQAHSARQAHRRYGRGSGSRAKLNFGDCFAYALARDRNEPLLFVGDDFTHTDITPALNPSAVARHLVLAGRVPPLRYLGAQRNLPHRINVLPALIHLSHRGVFPPASRHSVVRSATVGHDRATNAQQATPESASAFNPTGTPRG